MKSVKEHHLVGTLALALLALCLTGIAYATPPAPTPTPTATSSSTSSALGTGGFATAHTGDSNANSNNAVSFQDRLQAPSLLVPAVYPSGLCSSGGSLGISIPGGAISGGRTKHENESCAKREWFRLLSTDHPALALAIACSDPIVKAAAGNGLCEYKPPVVPAPCAVCQPSADTYTKDEVDAKLERVYKAATSK